MRVRKGIAMVTNAVMFLILCIFAFIPLLLGELAQNRSDNTLNDFILHNRNMNIVPLFGTVFSTWMSAFAFIGAIGYFVNEGPIYMTSIGWDALFGILFIIVGKRIWFYGRQHNYLTPVDFFDDIYNSKALNVVVNIVTIGCTMIYLQVQIIGGILVLNIATEGRVSIYMGALIFFMILVVYLWAGGLRAVAFTDLFYGVLTITAILASGFYIIHLAGGDDYVFNNLIEKNISYVTLIGSEGSRHTILWICLFLVVPLGAFMGPQLWIRNYASSKESNFNIMPLLICLASVLCLGALLAGSGCASMSTSSGNADGILIELIKENGNPYFYVFIVIGIYATIFSTANSQVHALSAIFTMDIYMRYVNKNAPEKKLLRIAKFAVIGVSAVSYLLVILVPQSVFDLAVIALGGTAQLIVPVLGALYWKESTPKGALIGLVSSEVMYIFFINFSRGDASVCSVICLIVNVFCFISASLTDTSRIRTRNKIISYKREYRTRNY